MTMVCRTCNQEKRIVEFPVDRSRPDGHCRQCRKCRAAYTKEWRHRDYSAHRQKCNANMRDKRREARQAVLAGYGSKCACCGEATAAFLALDHVNNDGREDREKWRTNHRIYIQAIRAGFPPRFQLLCHNCNMAKALVGECPHESERRAEARVDEILAWRDARSAGADHMRERGIGWRTQIQVSDRRAEGW